MAEIFFHRDDPADFDAAAALETLPDLPGLVTDGDIAVFIEGDKFVVMRRTAASEHVPDPGGVMRGDAIAVAATRVPQIAALDPAGWIRIDVPTG